MHNISGISLLIYFIFIRPPYFKTINVSINHSSTSISLSNHLSVIKYGVAYVKQEIKEKNLVKVL